MTARIHSPKSGVAEIIIDRDIKRNALNTATIQAITTAATHLQSDPELHVVVLKSEGTQAFSAGADIGELSALDATTAYDFIDALRGAIQAVADIPVPVVCRIQGACIGGAMELAAACDLRIASDTATFCMPEVLVGIPSVIQAALLPRLMGRGRAGWLVLSGEVIDATVAENWGFVERRVLTSDLDAAVSDAVAAILKAAPGAVRAQKRLLKDWDTLPLDQAITASMRPFADSYNTDEPATYLRNHRK
tara:strand:+ start:1054 stop:1800 length:747 start_codon:yes stop_codon:yes gene_type:complete